MKLTQIVTYRDIDMPLNIMKFEGQEVGKDKFLGLLNGVN